MTFDATIQHVYRGQHFDHRKEVVALEHRPNGPFEHHLYFWATAGDVYGKLLESLVTEAKARQLPLRLTTKETTWGTLLTYAEHVPATTGATV